LASNALYAQGKKVEGNLDRPIKPAGPIDFLIRSNPTCFIAGSTLGILDDSPALEKEPTPELLLTDATGSFANLPNNRFEKDLLEAGFIYKPIGSSHYYCPTDRAYEALRLLLDIGWVIKTAKGQLLLPQTNLQGSVQKDLQIEGSATFRTEKQPLKKLLQKRSRWIELDSQSVGLVDWKAVDTLVPPSIELLWNERGPRIARMAQCLDVTLQCEENLQQAILALRDQKRFPRALPGPTFQATLFPYQQDGVDWISFLYRWNLGGLLADEMGLGKTIQTIAFLSQIERDLPILIVAPASLLFQWRSELNRFLPGRSATILSYATLRQQIDTLSQTEYAVAILDESHMIKTATTQTAQAACRLQARFRLALSGTPLENRPEELQSQMHFLQVPFSHFRPFLLRRTKESVALQLPPKIQQTIWVEMAEEQRAIYAQARTPNMEILELILRLRQIACDPRLVGADSAGAKIDQLLLDVEAGGKILIYSQFTTLLTLAANSCRERGWNCLYLDGSTSLEQRAERVTRFQEDPQSCLFFLSLKAGGVGLNLTAADTVILLDPWWNESAEQQAIDRAHRIGQTKPLLIKRYLTPDSIEEKLKQLKEKKLQVAEELLGEETLDMAEALALLS
jgi:SNF2 family DNA or RNA helicase